MREKAVRCFSSAADVMRAPEGFMTSPAFAHLRWTLAGDQRREEMRLFSRKLLKRLDGLKMPFYPAVGLMDQRMAQHRFVMGADPWPPMSNPFLDGVAIRFQHCILPMLEPKCWDLFGEIAFDVARLAQIPVVWGGYNTDNPDPGFWQLYEGVVPDGMYVDRRTYGFRSKASPEVRTYESILGAIGV